MGNIWATADLSDDFVHELINETGFTRKQINRLYIRFRHLDKAKKGYLVKEDLAIVPAVRFSSYIILPCSDVTRVASLNMLRMFQFANLKN